MNLKRGKLGSSAGVNVESEGERGQATTRKDQCKVCASLVIKTGESFQQASCVFSLLTPSIAWCRGRHKVCSEVKLCRNNC